MWLSTTAVNGLSLFQQTVTEEKNQSWLNKYIFEIEARINVQFTSNMNGFLAVLLISCVVLLINVVTVVTSVKTLHQYVPHLHHF